MGRPTTTRYYTQAEAADLCGVSLDTIKRRRKAGSLPHTRQRPGDANGAWEIPLDDLVNAGLYELTPDGVDAADQTIREVRDDRELRDVRAELIRERAEREAQEQLLTELRGRVKWLERHCSDLAKGGGR